MGGGECGDGLWWVAGCGGLMFLVEMAGSG